MNRANELKDIHALAADKRRWQWIAASMLLVIILQVLLLLGRSYDTKTIFLPANAGTTNKPFWVADAGASPEYYQLTADYVAQLALTGDAKSSPYNIDRLVTIAHPSLRGTLKAELDALALKMKAENLTQVFYPVEYYLGNNRPVVAIKGTLKTWMGDKLISSKDQVYRMSFIIEAGRVYLQEFKEAQAHDPLNAETKSIQAGQAP